LLYHTMLFTPANDLRKAGKVLMSDADAIVLDLRDALALSEKNQHQGSPQRGIEFAAQKGCLHASQHHPNRINLERFAGCCV